MTTDEKRTSLVRDTRSHVIKSIQWRLLTGMLELMSMSDVSAVAIYFSEVHPTWGEPSDEEFGILAAWARNIVEAEVNDYDVWEVVRVTESLERLDVTIHGEGAEVYEIFIPVATDSPLQRFLQEFDDGAFPDLTEAAYRAIIADDDGA